MDKKHVANDLDIEKMQILKKAFKTAFTDRSDKQKHLKCNANSNFKHFANMDSRSYKIDQKCIFG